MKNKRGFTLIELIVTIVIMISILIIAVISVTNISGKNKNNMWEKTKNEVETAAIDYFETNEFYLNSMVDGDAARISVGKLVEEDYINAVIDPRSETKVNNCDYVEVTYENNSYIYQYYENDGSESCNTLNYITLVETGAPSIDVAMSESPTGNNDYYIKNVNINAKVNTNQNGAINEVKYSFDGTNYSLLTVKPEKEETYSVSAIDGNSITVTFVATNISGKKATGSITYSKDTVMPVINSFNIESLEEKYNTANAKLSWNIKDDESGIGIVKTNVKNNNGNNEWNRNGDSSWNFTGKDRYFIISKSLDGKNIIPKLEVYDVAGNKNTQALNSYTVYKECSEIKEGNITEGNFGKCSNTCGNGVKEKTITTNYNDKYTGKVCSSSQEKITQSCSDKSGCTPLISNVSFRYNKEKCPNGWVEIKYKGINIEKYTASMTYSHSVQGTTNSTIADKSEKSDETFCRGYGSSSKNIMTFEVEIVNNLNKNKKATYKGTCNWSKMYTNGKVNTDWHDCTLSK